MTGSIRFLRDAVIYVTAAVLVLGIPALSFWGVWIFVTGQFGSNTIGPVANLVGQFLTSLGGAGVGAYFAFKFDKEERTRDENRRNAEAASLAIVRLSQMYSLYWAYQQQLLKPLDDMPPEGHWFLLKPGAIMTGEVPTIDLGALKFLFQGKDLDVVGEVGMEEIRFRAAVDLVDRRTRLHQEEVHRILESASLVVPITSQMVEEILGRRISQTMKSYTKQIVFDVEMGLKTTIQLANRLRDAALPLVGGERVVRIASHPEQVMLKNQIQQSPGGSGLPEA